MGQIAQPSETEFAAQFHIAGRAAILFMLAGFVREREPFVAHFGHGGESFITTLLAVEAERERLIVDCSGSPDTNRRFLISDRNFFVGRPDGIEVHFSSGLARAVDFEGREAFAVPLPRYLVRLQRRDAFRIETPRLRPLQFFSRLPDGALLTLPVHDISVAGIGLTAVAPPDGLTPGGELVNCRFALPEESSDLFFSARVRHMTEIEMRAGYRQWRLGLRFDELPLGDANRIQRYIVRSEHERRERT